MWIDRTVVRFIFIDEIEQAERKAGFFGVASLVVDSCHYSALKKGVDGALDQAGWKRDAEFKGRFIFSKAGDSGVVIEKRIELVRTIVATTTAKKNARARFYFAHNGKGNSGDNYVYLVGKVVEKCPKPQNQTQDKPLVSIYLDHTTLVKPKKVEEVVEPILADRYLKLVETPVLLPSSNSTAGLIAADVLAYLKSWDVIFPDPGEAEQASLFQTETQKLNAKKLADIRNILDLIKQVEVIAAD